MRTVLTLLAAFFVATGSSATPIDLTFSARGEASIVESVTVTNLTHTDIAAVTLKGTATLRLNDLDATSGEGDVNGDGKADIADVLAVAKTIGGNTTYLTTADVNGDSKVNHADISYIISLIAGTNPARMVNLQSSTFNVQSSDVVTMDFHPGDILRFEGTSDGMRMIHHLSPESSHPVFFDFYRCQDVNGYNYPIVRFGDMLWMMEDLRPQKMNGLLYSANNATLWKGLEDYAAAEFVVDNERAYYTIEGARLAMPKGWQMPSIDEIYAFVKELKADTLTIGDFMKDRDFDWPLSLQEGLDTLHLNLLANGYISEEGVLTDETLLGLWPTRSTINHGHPATFEIRATNSRLYPYVEHPRRCAFTVRGCRPAPSVYQEMLQEVFSANKEAALKAPRRMPMQLVNDNGPLGGYYTFGSTRSSIMFDYGGEQLGGSRVEQRSGILYKNNNSNNWVFTDKSLVDFNVNGMDSRRQLRKLTAQGNASGYDNAVYATWSKEFRVYTDGTTKGSVATVASVMGEGVVYLTIYGDSTKNHAVLEGYEKRPLLDAQGNEYQWVMPSFDNSKLSRKVYDGNRLADFRREYFARAFNLKCIQDETGDGVEEIVMNVANKIAVFDGVTLRCIREHVFEDKGSYIGTPNLRFDVADVNNDGYKDIVLILNSNNGMGYLHVYSKGYIDEDPIFTKDIGSSTLFCDVKVGNMSGHEYPEIAILTRGMETGSNNLLTKNGYLYVSRLGYDDNLNLTETIVLSQTSVNCFAADNATRNHLGNMDLVFGHFRGRSYNEDLIVGDGLWRYDDAQMKPTYRFQVLSGTINASRTIPADAITAVTVNESKDLLVFIWIINSDMDSSNNTEAFAEFGEVWLNNDGNSASYSLTHNEKIFGFANSGPYYHNDTKNPEVSNYWDYNVGYEFNANPVLCRFVDRERANHFRFISHEVTFSEPRVYAAIAAAPYYKDLEGSDNAETTWGIETSDGVSTAKSDTWGGSIIAGYEYSFSVPFLCSGGVDFTTKVSAAASVATSHEVTTSFGDSYSAGRDHVVVMQATPFDTYRYEIVSSDNPDEIGTEFVVSMPRIRRFVPLTLEDYVRLTASQKGVAKPQRYLTATPGVPSSYPPLYDPNSGKYFVNDEHPFLQGRDPNGGNTFGMAGTGKYSTRTISLATSDSKTTSVEIGVEMELVANVNGVKAGVGFNYNHTNEHSHTIGKELTVSGSVPGLPSMNDPEHPQFNWNIYWYYVKDEGGVYPVVNYAVTEK